MRESLSSYVEHLKNLDQAKSNFIALASHELRTPLTVITGFNEMITSGALGEVSENVRETAGVIKEQLTGLNRMVQSMLDLTYLEQGIQTMMLAPTDMTALARAALATRSDVIASRNLKADMSAPAGAVWANVDADRMQDAVTRILDNAIRFTPDGGQVAITVTREKSQAVIAIADNGVGIPPQELKWIFQKVYEVGDVMHHTSGQHGFRSGGLGLGLALCKAVVEHHGGSIAVESTPGRGSEFQIRLQSMSPPPGNVVTLPEEEKGVLV